MVAPDITLESRPVAYEDMSIILQIFVFFGLLSFSHFTIQN